MQSVRKPFSILVLLATIGMICSGCQQFVIISYLLHGPPSIEPDFDAETGESLSAPGVTVAVVCFAPKELQWKHPQIDQQVSTYVAQRLSQNHISTVHPDRVQAWVDEHADWERAEEIGTAFHANYVIEIEIADFSLHEGSSTTLLRGKTEAYVSVVKVHEDGYGEQVFTKELDFTFPTRVPRPTSGTTVSSFQREYLSRLSERIGWMFYERFHGDMIGWAD